MLDLFQKPQYLLIGNRDVVLSFSHSAVVVKPGNEMECMVILFVKDERTLYGEKNEI